MTRREEVANRVSDGIVDLLKAELHREPPCNGTDIFAGLLLGLLAYGNTMPRAKPAPVLILLSAAEACLLACGAISTHVSEGHAGACGECASEVTP